VENICNQEKVTEKWRKLHSEEFHDLSLSLALQPFWTLAASSARRKAATYTQNNTNTEKKHIQIDASNGIRTQDPSV
jgi:hypothetical protein